MKKLFLIVIIFIFPLGKIFSAEYDMVKEIFKDSQTIETKEVTFTDDNKNQVYIFHIGKTKEIIDGYCIMLDEQGKHGTITFLIVIDAKGKIKEARVLEHSEVKGARINKRRFLNQFIGKGLKDAISLRKDIIAVTGATISSQAAVNAVKKALLIWEAETNKSGD